MSKRITKGGDLTIGLDLGDEYSEACVVDGSGEVLETFRVRTTQAALDRALSRFESARVVLEVGTNSPWVSRLVARHGHEIFVANPRRVRLIAETDSKSDRFGAELVARPSSVAMPVATATPSPEPRATAVPLKSIVERSASGASVATGWTSLSIGSDAPVMGGGRADPEPLPATRGDRRLLSTWRWAGAGQGPGTARHIASAACGKPPQGGGRFLPARSLLRFPPSSNAPAPGTFVAHLQAGYLGEISHADDLEE